MFLYMQQNNEMEAKLLDPDYHYGYYFYFVRPNYLY